MQAVPAMRPHPPPSTVGLCAHAARGKLGECQACGVVWSAPSKARAPEAAPEEGIEDFVGVKLLGAAGPSQPWGLFPIAVVGSTLVAIAQAREGLGHHCTSYKVSWLLLQDRLQSDKVLMLT